MAAVPLESLIPRVRRAIDGPWASDAGSPAATLRDEEVRAMAADAIAEIIFYSEGAFAHELVVSARDEQYEAPTDWAIDPALTEPEITVVTAQAALNYFFHTLTGLKTTETIRDEGQEWSYSIAANAVTERLKELRAARDRALDVVLGGNPAPVMFISLLEERDRLTSRLVEPLGGEWY